MKNYKTERETTENEEQKIKFIFENRLQLQSTQRYLDEYNIPRKSFDYFKSKDFVNGHFMKWSAFRKKNFLIKMVGTTYWKKFQDILEKGI